MENNVILNKIAIIERCINRVYEVYEENPLNLEDYTKQDSIVLNIQRACEATIDLAMHICAKKGLGVPQASKDAFLFMKDKNMISKSLTDKMVNMIGFRNILVHDYQEINLNILQSIVEDELEDLKEYTKIILKI